jgi:ubiquinone/menaquinone biosynthesis C-methylase UbiE
VTALDSAARFSATADDYDRYRPEYPDDIFDWLTALAGITPGARVIDLGCGTGIASRPWVARGARVVGIDGNPRMLAYARARGGGVHYAQARVEALPLGAGAAQLATMAQAAHWLVVEPARRAQVLAELARVATWAVAYWNQRADTPLGRAYEALVRTHTAERARVPTMQQALAALRQALPEVHERRCVHVQRLDRAGLIGRAWSSSYVAHGVVDRAAFDGALGALFERHSEDGVVAFAYDTVALAWRTRP